MPVVENLWVFRATYDADLGHVNIEEVRGNSPSIGLRLPDDVLLYFARRLKEMKATKAAVPKEGR